METHPKTIWLQYHGDQKPEAGEVVSMRDVTWSEHKEFAWDVGPYVLRSEIERENARLREAIQNMMLSLSVDNAEQAKWTGQAILEEFPSA